MRGTYAGAVDARPGRLDRDPPCGIPPHYQGGADGEERDHRQNQPVMVSLISEIGLCGFSRRRSD